MAAPAPKAKDRIDLRLYNTIVIYDVYTIARSPDAARDALLAAIESGDAKPSEVVRREVTMKNSIRESWIDQTPFVASDVSDDEFETLRGITAGSAFEKFYGPNIDDLAMASLHLRGRIRLGP